MAVRVWEYATPSVPEGSGQTVAIVGAVATGLSVREHDLPLDSGEGVVESATWTVKLAVPATVGVPETTPAAESTIPAGNAPAVSE